LPPETEIPSLKTRRGWIDYWLLGVLIRRLQVSPGPDLPPPCFIIDTTDIASSGVNIGMPSQSQAYPLPGVTEGYPNLSGVMPNTAFAYPISTPSDSQAGSSTLPFTPSMFDPSTPGFMAPAVDPTQFMWAMSSRLPMVEESSPNDERTSASGPSPLGAEGSRLRQSTRRKGAGTSDGKIVKISWWRPHGQTAIAPGGCDAPSPFTAPAPVPASVARLADV
jgi:hypothetical protein